ncbi:MAG: dockerin type I repeat-containing protein, partial [Clostridia bacterium]|nr:dockerin type I repeat-containing protein [Clostridia bacterium]
ADSDDADHKCDHCGTDGITGHVYGEEWKTDTTNHWHECACGAKSGEGDHVYDNACDADCNECGAQRTPADHVYDNDCDAECNVCNATRIPADHIYDNACDADCNECGATRTPADHDYNSAVTTAPTCTETGVMTYTCECGDSYTEEVAALGHTAGAVVVENNVAADCENEGSYDNVTYCTVCGDEHSRETVTVAALGHSYENGKCVNCGKYESAMVQVKAYNIGEQNYLVAGKTIIVDPANIVDSENPRACRLGYLVGSAYVSVTPVLVDGKYLYTVPEGVTEVVLVVKGDVNLDGDVSAEDLTALARQVAKIETLSDPAAIFAADVTANYDLSAEDLTLLARIVAKIETSVAWN